MCNILNIYYTRLHIYPENKSININTIDPHTSKAMSALCGGHHHSPRTVSPQIWFPWRQHSIARHRTGRASSAEAHHVEGADQLPVGGDGPQTGAHWAIELDDPKSSLSALSFQTRHVDMQRFNDDAGSDDRQMNFYRDAALFRHKSRLKMMIK